MTLIISGYFDFEDNEDVPSILKSAMPLIEGALTETGCIAYAWTQDHTVNNRVWVYEEWTTSEALADHLNSHWYRDMGAHLRKFSRKSQEKPIKKFRVDHEEPVYDETGTPRADFFTLPQ